MSLPLFLRSELSVPRNAVEMIEPHRARDLLRPLGEVGTAGAITGIVARVASPALHTSFYMPLHFGELPARAQIEAVSPHPTLAMVSLVVFGACYTFARYAEEVVSSSTPVENAKRSTFTKPQKFVRGLGRTLTAIASLEAKHSHRDATEIDSTFEA